MTPATPHHAAALAAIHAEAFPQSISGEAPWDQASFQILLNQPGVSAFIDERGGMVVIRTVADEAEILTIGVAQPRQGIGKTLMQAAVAQARRLGVEKLHLEVAASNFAARALYESLGFEQAGERQNYYADGTDALILTLSLSGAGHRAP